MATRDTGQPVGGVTRRDFIKATAAASAAAGCGLGFAFDADKALAYEGNPLYDITTTTCPYCSASCGQRVVVAKTGPDAGKVIDLYGDYQSPMNSGGLCSKGAGSWQLVTNERRVGAWPGAHPVNDAFSAIPETGAFASGVAYRREGNNDWVPVGLNAAMAEIATGMKSARGYIGNAGTGEIFNSAGETIDSVAYTGFSGLQAIRRPDGKYFVITNGNKVDAPTLAGLLTGLPGTAAGLVAAFDELVFVASDPMDRGSYAFVGRGDLGTVLLAEGVLGNTGHVVYDGSGYVAYTSDTSGNMHTATSSDMLDWAYGAAIGTPGNVAGPKSPSVLVEGSTVHCWFSLESGGTTLHYSSYNGTVWTAAVPVTINGAPTINFTGHPYVMRDDSGITLYYAPAGRIRRASAATAGAAFGPSTELYVASPSNSVGNVSAGPGWVLFTQYHTPGFALGWAYSGARFAAMARSNSKQVAFFGSSHMNNEENYAYRKLIAGFGTSNVEHQARI